MGLILLPFVFLLMATLFSVTRGLKTLNFLFPVPHMVCYQGLCVKSISVVLFTFARFKAMLNSNRHHWVRALSTFHPAFCLVTSSGLFPVPVQLWYHFSAPNSSVSLGLWGKSKLFTQTCKNLLKSHSSNLSLFTITELCSMSTFHASVDSMVWPSQCWSTALCTITECRSPLWASAHVTPWPQQCSLHSLNDLLFSWTEWHLPCPLNTYFAWVVSRVMCVPSCSSLHSHGSNCITSHRKSSKSHEVSGV